MQPKLTKLFLALSVSALVVPLYSFAAYFKIGKDMVVNSADPINQNAYIIGSDVTVSSAVEGDLYAVGGTVIVSGKVSHDLMLAGGNINVSGASGEDIRVVGGNVTLGGIYSGELVGAGGQLIVGANTTIAKDISWRGESVVFEGSAGGNVDIAARTLYIDGTVGKNLTLHGAEKITLGSHAVIKGNLEYFSPVPLMREVGAKITGKTIFHQVAMPSLSPRDNPSFGWMVGLLTVWAILKMLMILTMAYLLWHFWRKDTMGAITRVKTHFGQSLLRGFAFAVLIPVAAFVACFTVLGIPLAFLAGLAYVALLILAGPVAVLFVATLISHGYPALRWYHPVLGVLAFSIVAVIPFVGWVAASLVYLASLGAVVDVLKPKFKRG